MKKPAAFRQSVSLGSVAARKRTTRKLLPVISKYFSTGSGELTSMLQEALPNGVVPCVHHLPTVVRDIARTCLLLL